MVELKLLNFNMFEKAPYELPDVRPFIELAMKGVKEIEKVYGPVFITKYIEYALWFISKKLGEKNFGAINTLEQLVDYLVSISNKYPTPYCACTYAQIKTENLLQGQTGAGTRVESMRISKNIAEAGKINARNLNLDEILSKIRQTGISIKAVPSEMGYKKNDDGSVDIVWPNCYLLDGCKLAFEEGLLKRPGGRLRCGLGEGICQLFKIFTGYEWDYELLEFNKPYCIHKCYVL